MSTVLVTGANGFVGRNVIRRLRTADVSVIGAMRKIPNKDNQTLTARLFELENVSKTNVSDVSVVVHTAAAVHKNYTKPASVLKYNCRNTVEFARHCAENGVECFIFLSTVGIHGNTADTVINESSQVNCSSVYATSKLNAEIELKRISESFDNFKVVIIRPPMIYGNEAKGNFSLLLKAMKRGIPLPLASIRNKRTFCHIDNLSDFILEVVKKDVYQSLSSDTFIICDDENVSTVDLMSFISEAYQVQPRLYPFSQKILEVGLQFIGKKSIANSLLKNLVLDNTRAKTETSWKPNKYLEG